MLAIGVAGCDLSLVIEAPQEPTVLSVPHDIAEIVHSVRDDRSKLISQVRALHYNLGRQPSDASLEDRKLSFAPGALPVAREVGIEATVQVVDGSWKPHAEYVSAQCHFHLVSQLEVVSFGWRKVSNWRRLAG